MDVQPAQLAPLSAEELAVVRARVLVQRPLHWSITLRLVLEVMRSREAAAHEAAAASPIAAEGASEGAPTEGRAAPVASGGERAQVLRSFERSSLSEGAPPGV